jgi:hypothetical protein
MQVPVSEDPLKSAENGGCKNYHPSKTVEGPARCYYCAAESALPLSAGGAAGRRGEMALGRLGRLLEGLPVRVQCGLAGTAGCRAGTF